MKVAALTAIAGFYLVSSASIAEAASLSTSGTWTNIVAAPIGGAISGAGTNSMSWGTPATGSGQSGYDFVGVAENVSMTDLISSTFLLGTFTHRNFPISGTSLDTATLNVDFSLDTFSQTFSFGFDHFETPNGANPCPAGGAPPCPDLVSFPNAVSSEFVTIEGVDYNLTLTGFSQGGPSNAVDAFLTLEGQSNSAGLYAMLTEVEGEAVPEPSGLVGLAAIGGLVTVLRRKKG